MRKLFTALFIYSFTLAAQAQYSWESIPNSPTSFWDMDTLNNKLYVAAGGIYELNGNAFTWLNDYNETYNAPNISKSCVKTIDGILYAGAKDFNTSGEGDIHYYNGSSWSLFQNTDLPYHGNYKIRAFEKFNGSIYMAGNFRVPTDLSYYGLAKWDGTDWVHAGKSFDNSGSPYEVRDMEEYQNKLYITANNQVWVYDGVSWTSLFNDVATPFVYPMATTVNNLIVYNNDLYISGSFYLDDDNFGVTLVKYNGSTFSAIDKNTIGQTYSNMGRMSVVNNTLLFAAKKSTDNHTYLLSFDGSAISELTKLADYGDYAIFPGVEYTNYVEFFYHDGKLWAGGNFSKIGGESIEGLAYTGSYSSSAATGSITQPAAMSSLAVNSDVLFTWAVENTSSIVLEYSEDNGNNWNIIVSNLPANNQKISAMQNGQYSWTIPSSITSSSIIVRLKDYSSGTELQRAEYLITGTTGISGGVSSDFRIYPNPSAGTFYIEGYGDDYKVSILNAWGNEVFQGNLSSGASIDLNHLPKGIYFCKLMKEKYIETVKIVVE